jgi:hypothetical protein
MAEPIEIDSSRADIEQLIGNPFEYLAYPPVSELPREILDSFASSLAILWQAVRFATLVHDLGHLPTSHLFEQAIYDLDKDNGELQKIRRSLAERFEIYRSNQRWPDLIAEEPPIHEMMGCMLFEHLKPSSGALSADENNLYRWISWISKAIVLIKPSHYAPITTPPDASGMKVVRFLHSIISGELDADRLDYCARDPLASGTEFGSINLRKLVRSQVLVTKDNELRLAVDRRALADVESFFVQRYFAFRTVVFDHNVARSEAILRSIIQDLIAETLDSGSPIRNTVSPYHFWSPSGEDPELGLLVPDPTLIGRFDDTWLRSMLYSVWRELVDTKSLSPRCERLRCFIDITLHRKISDCWTVAKTDVDSYALVETAVTAFTSSTCGAGKPSEDDLKVARNLVRGVFGSSAFGPAIQAELDNLFPFGSEDGTVFALAHYEELKFPHADQRDHPVLIRGEHPYRLWGLHEVSPLLSALSECVNRGRIPRLRVFLIGPRIRSMRESATPAEWNSLRDRCVDAIVTVAGEIKDWDQKS